MTAAAATAPWREHVPDTLDFANVLFAGPCNRFCPWCIGKQIDERLSRNTLNQYPPTNLDTFIEGVNELGIKQVVFTGTNTDPQLYRHQARLLSQLRERVTTGAKYSIHTNGALALRQIDTFNLYDKSCISFPSFEPATYAKLMGVPKVPDLARIIEGARIEVKVSCILNEHNVHEVDDFILRCSKLGVRRIVYRKVFGDAREWNIFGGIREVGRFRNNPVYNLHGVEVTYWNFEDSTCRSINLFPDGTVGANYLLAGTTPI